MGILDQMAADAVDVYADDLLREVYPDQTAEILAAMLGLGAGKPAGGQDVYVDGQYKGLYQGPHVDNEFV
jgi:hypothetical protein